MNRGIQVNQTVDKFTASVSWNDGFYSNRYSWMSGSLTYANGPHSLAFAAMGNLVSVAAKKCTILAGRKRRWSGYGLATAAAA